MPAPSWCLMSLGEEVQSSEYSSQGSPLCSLWTAGRRGPLRPERTRNSPTNGGVAGMCDGLGHRTCGEISPRNKAHKRAVTPCSWRTQEMQAGNRGLKASLEYRIPTNNAKLGYQTFGKKFILSQIDAIARGHHHMIHQLMRTITQFEVHLVSVGGRGKYSEAGGGG